MASLQALSNGRRVIQFQGADLKRRSIRLGLMPAKQAEAVKVKIESLVIAAATNLPLDIDTAKWVAGLDDTLASKLSAVGLIEHRRRPTLDEWLTLYIDERAADSNLKPSSLKKLKQAATKLREILPALPTPVPLATRIDKLTALSGKAWQQTLAKGSSRAYMRTMTGNAKTIFNEAVARKLIESNPFATLASGSTASGTKTVISREDFKRFIDALPNTQWKLYFALARYAALRVPSESQALTWGDVDFDGARLSVTSVKTQHHVGHERRQVPIDPDLMILLRDRFEEAAEGSQSVCTINGPGNIRRVFRAACRRAGLSEWKRMMQTLRSSCEIEWAAYLPQYAVSKMVGHSIVVSGKHYANSVGDEIFEKVSGRAVQKAVHESHRVGAKGGAATGREISQPITNFAGTLGISDVNCEVVRTVAIHHDIESIGLGGFEPPTS